MPLKGNENGRGLRWWSGFLLRYGLMWLACAGAIVAVFRLYRTSFLFVYDGIYQHFAAYRYVCRYLSALTSGGGAGLSFFNYSLGQGADVLTTLNSYNFTDPVCWLTALLPLPELTRYTAMVFAKLFLIGLSFGVYCRQTRRRDPLWCAIGALGYTFCGAVIHVFARHPNFITWAYCFPLMLAGGERYWRRGKGGLLVVAVLLNAVTNYYAFYMNAVLFALFTVLRAVVEVAGRRMKLREALAECLRTAGVCLLGTLLSMAVLLPTLYAFSVNTRLKAVGGYTDSLLRFPMRYYLELPFTLVTAFTTPGYYAFTGVPALALGAIVFLLARRGRWRMKLALVGMVAMLCVPLAGKALNGFGYVSNRWVYALCFLACVALTDALPRLRRTAGWRRGLVVAALAAYAALLAGYVFTHRKAMPLATALGALALLAASAVLVALARRLGRRGWRWTMAVLAVFGALYQGVFAFLPFAGNYLEEYLPRAGVNRCFTGHSSVAAADLADGFYRVEEKEYCTNTDGYNGTHGTSVWWSLIPQTVADYYESFAMDSQSQNCRFFGLGGRAALLEAASVRYYTAPADDVSLVPYGYDALPAASDGEWAVFENRYALPVGYAYAGYMLKADYDALPALEKQQALMQCAVLDEAPEGQRAVAPVTGAETLPCAVTGCDGVEPTADGYRVTRPGGVLRLSADVPEDREVYLVMKGVRLKDVKASKFSGMLILDASRRCGDFRGEREAAMFMPDYNWPVIRDGFSFCLGWGGAGKNEFEIRFQGQGSFACEGIELALLPVADYAAQAEALRAAAMKDVRVGADEVAGSVALDAPGILQFSIPYSVGWSARVDGARTKLLPSGGMYMALPLDAGAHEIRLQYRTPWLREGIAISLATLAFAVVHGIAKARRRRKGGSRA